MRRRTSLRVWTLASGALIGQHGHAGGAITQCLSNYMNHFAHQSLGRGPFSFSEYWRNPQPCVAKSTFGGYGTAAFNGPISYLPAVFTVAVLRGFGAPVPLIFFAGRFATLLAFVGVFSRDSFDPYGKASAIRTGLASHYARNGIFVLCRSDDHLFGGAGHQSYAEVTPF